MVALLQGGAERGWEQAVLNPFARSPHEELAERCRGLRLRGVRRARLPPASPARDDAGGPAGASAELRPDVLQVYLTHALVLAAALPRRGGEVRVLSHQHGMHFEAADRKLAASVDRLAGRRFDHIVACSDSVREFLIESYRYSAERVTSIRNGWSGTPLKLRRESRPTIVCTANFSAEKGHEVLIDAFATVAQRIPDSRLVLLGHGAEMAAVESQVGELGLTERVQFAGFQDSIWPLLARAHVFALPSNYESLGIAVLEGMAAGLPVVATAVGGVTELVQPGVTGELVPPGDPAAMAAALAAVLGDPDTAMRMGNAGRAAAEDERMSTCVERYFDLYEQLLSEQRAA